MKKNTPISEQPEEKPITLNVISSKDELVEFIDNMLNIVDISLKEETDIKKELIKTSEFLKVLKIAFNKKTLPNGLQKTTNYPLLKMKS